MSNRYDCPEANPSSGHVRLPMPKDSEIGAELYRLADVSNGNLKRLSELADRLSPVLSAKRQPSEETQPESDPSSEIGLAIRTIRNLARTVGIEMEDILARLAL